MTPPETKSIGPSAEDALSAAVSSCAPPETLKKRQDFQRANRAPRVATPGFVLQARKRAEHSPSIRVGYTCSKKVGNAVARNRAKRRLREVVRLTLPALAHCGYDYVLIGRRDQTANLPFETLRDDLVKALTIIHGSTK